MCLYSTNLNRGEIYEKLKTVLGINFIDEVRSSKLVKEMIKENETIDKIQKYTNLSLDEIKEEMK